MYLPSMRAVEFCGHTDALDLAKSTEKFADFRLGAFKGNVLDKQLRPFRLDHFTLVIVTC